MDIIIHFGAHRCATTSFQEYLHHNAPALAKHGIAVWGREKMKETGLHALRSMTPESHTALQQELDRCQKQGVEHLLVTEENFLGTMRENFNKGELYPTVGSRARLVSDAFGGRVTKLGLNIRALNTYWTSVASYAVRNKRKFGCDMRWPKVAQHPRSWQAVITDLKGAFPKVPLLVLPFEEFAGRPDRQLACLVDIPVPPFEASNLWINKDGNEEIQVPKSAQEMSLMMKFADDLSWLESGADGLARLCLGQELERGLEMPAEKVDERNTQ